MWFYVEMYPLSITQKKNIYRTFLWSFLENCAMFYIFFTLHLITFGEFLYYGLLWFNSYGKVKILNKIMKLWFYVYKDNESHLRESYIFNFLWSHFSFNNYYWVQRLCSWQHQIHQTAHKQKVFPPDIFDLYYLIELTMKVFIIFYLFLIFFLRLREFLLKKIWRIKTWHNNTASDKIYLYTQQKKKKKIIWNRNTFHLPDKVQSKKKHKTQNLSSNLFRFWYANYQCV